MTQARITVTRDSIDIDGLRLTDASLAAFVAETPEADRGALAERALRIGLLTLANAGVSLSADVVKAEFEHLYDRMEQTQLKATEALAQTLRENFADGDGRLPRTLESFLGDRGKLRSMVDELFDPTRRDSAIGRIGTMLESYFDGDGSRLAQLLDPTRMHSPLHQFRTEMDNGFKAVQERLAGLEAAHLARAGERSRSAAKGGDFEDLLESMLGDIARGADDILERTGTEAGDAGRSKKGDFVLTLDPALTPGCELRVVIEAKNRGMSGREMRDELRAAKTNRDAAVGLVVFTSEHAPAGIAPFDVRAGDVYAVLDPADPDPATLLAAVRLARLLALASVRDPGAPLDTSSITEGLRTIREALEVIRALKVQLTNIGTSSTNVSNSLDKLRAVVIASIEQAERVIAAKV